ncbi:MAG TPA: hypothetical protein VH349_08765 [Ktedonobacterales bacterium]|jgi:hypothetical protein
MTSENPITELERSYLIFAQAILKAATNDEKLGRLSNVIRPKAVFISGTAHIDYEQTPSYQSLLFNQEGKYKEGIDACLIPHWREEMLRIPSFWAEQTLLTATPTYDEARHFYYQAFLQPILDIVISKRSLDLTDDEILDSYRQYRNEWSSGQARHDTVTMLINFESEVLETVFPSGQHLSSLTSQEKAKIWEDATLSSPLIAMPVSVEDVIVSKFKLSGEYKRSYEVPYVPPIGIHDNLQDTITALRLLKGGAVEAPLTIDRSRLHYVWHEDTNRLFNPDYYANNYTAPYILQQNDLAELTTLMNALHSLPRPSQRGLYLALQRFNRSYARTIQEDRLIDLTIVLESTLLAGKNNELTYRLAMLGAYLLREKWPPKKTKLMLETIYDIRSKIVHEGKLLSDVPSRLRKAGVTADIPEFMRVCEDLVRDVLRTFVLQIASANLSGSLSVTTFVDQLGEKVLDTFNG